MPGTYWNTVLKSFEGNAAAVPSVAENMDISISPNPSSSSVTLVIRGASRVKKLSLYDVPGHEVKLITIQNNAAQFNVEDLPSGEYLVLLQCETGVIQKRLVVLK